MKRKMMRRGSFKSTYLYLLAVAAFLQLVAIVSDQLVLQLDAITKKNESQLVLAEMQSENALNINLILTEIQRHVIDTLYNIDEYNESIDENQKKIILSKVHKTGSDLYHVLTADYVTKDIVDSKIVNDISNLVSYKITEKKFAEYYDEVLNNFYEFTDIIQLYGDQTFKSVAETKRLINKVSKLNKFRHRLILLGVISQILSLFVLLMFFRFIINDRIK